MATKDMDSTIRFWRDLLGMRLVAGLGHPGYRHYFLEISGHDMIAFFEWPGVEPLEEKDHGVPVKGPFAFDHVSFEVASDDDLWEIKDKLEAADMWCSEVVDHGFIHSIYAFDPNNIAIEFSCPVAECDVHAHPIMIDSHPTPAALEGSEPCPGHWRRPSGPTVEHETYPGEAQSVRAAFQIADGTGANAGPLGQCFLRQPRGDPVPA